MILTETKVMTERVKKQALEGRDDSNKVAMKLNDLAKRIRTTTRKMMAKVSELSMNQATALSLHQEKTEKEALIQDVTERMKAAGSSIIPWEDVEIELKRAEKVSARKELDKKRRQEAMSREMAKTTGQFVDLYVLWTNHIAPLGMTTDSTLSTSTEPRPSPDQMHIYRAIIHCRFPSHMGDRHLSNRPSKGLRCDTTGSQPTRRSKYKFLHSHQ